MPKKKTYKQIWRSAEEKLYPALSQNEMWRDGREFSYSIEDLIAQGLDQELSRKKFFQLMGASITMATVSCVKAPVEKIVPYVERPLEHIPGEAIYYATARVTSDGVYPILVKTREGKPIKIEGHRDHPLFRELFELTPLLPYGIFMIPIG